MSDPPDFLNTGPPVIVYPDEIKSNNYVLNELKQSGIQSQTSWNEVKTSGKTALEASSTTYSRNSRFGLLENGEWVTPQRFDELVTEDPPKYTVTVPPGETYIVTGKERNPYTPGLDYTTAIASQFSEEGGDNRIAPEGITVTQGFGDLRENIEEGIVLIFDDDARAATLKDGNIDVSKSLENGEWFFDPFDSDDFEYDLTKFVVKRFEGNLYGSGSQRVYMKLRDITTGVESYQKVAEVGNPQEPILNVFNLFNQIRVENNRDTGFEFSFGPTQFFSEGDVSIPRRDKESPKRNIPVNATFGDTLGTVIAVYRKDPENIEVPITARIGAKAQTDGRLELREVHPDYVDFGTINPDDPANWGPPPRLKPRETAIQALDFTVGDVSLTAVNNRSPGEQASTVEYDGQSTGGGRADPREAGDSERLNEFDYFVVVAFHDSTSEDLIRYRLFTTEFW